MDVSTHFCVSSTLDFRCRDLLMDSFARSEHVVRRQFECDEHRMDFSGTFRAPTECVCRRTRFFSGLFSNQAIFPIPLIILGDTLRGAIPTECGQRAHTRESDGDPRDEGASSVQGSLGFSHRRPRSSSEITVVRDNEVRVSRR